MKLLPRKGGRQAICVANCVAILAYYPLFPAYFAQNHHLLAILWIKDEILAEGTRLGSNRLWGFFDFGEDMNSALFVQAYDIVLSEGAIGISRAI